MVYLRCKEGKVKTRKDVIKMTKGRLIDIAGWCGLYDKDIDELVRDYKGFEAIEAITTIYGVPEEEVHWAIDQSYKYYN